MKPYGICSDTHCHNWSAFSGVDDQGNNTRLVAILNEMDRCAEETARAGGEVVYHAGDLFHVRGSVAPSVFNYTKQRMLESARKYNIYWRIMPGNHDMEDKHGRALSQATLSMETDSIIEVCTHSHIYSDRVAQIPWVEDLKLLKTMLDNTTVWGDKKAEIDLIIHAPVNGVIMNIPDHGLEPEYLHSLGFRRVFAGHYHNHKIFPVTAADAKVFSIGAIAHHTWSDVGSMAGFLVVHPDKEVFHLSKAPKFQDISADMDPKHLPSAVNGNYVRAMMDSAKLADVEKVRAGLIKLGALGVVIKSVKKPVVQRQGASVKAGASLEQAVSDFITGNLDPNHVAAVNAESQKVLTEAGANGNYGA